MKFDLNSTSHWSGTKKSHSHPWGNVEAIHAYPTLKIMIICSLTAGFLKTECSDLPRSISRDFFVPDQWLVEFKSNLTRLTCKVKFDLNSTSHWSGTKKSHSHPWGNVEAIHAYPTLKIMIICSLTAGFLKTECSDLPRSISRDFFVPDQWLVEFKSNFTLQVSLV